MITKELLDYIKAQRGAGVSKSLIDKTLLDSGWFQNDLDEAYGELHKKQSLSDVHPDFEPVSSPQVKPSIAQEQKFDNATDASSTSALGKPKDDAKQALATSSINTPGTQAQVADKSPKEIQKDEVFDINHVEEANHADSPSSSKATSPALAQHSLGSLQERAESPGMDTTSTGAVGGSHTPLVQTSNPPVQQNTQSAGQIHHTSPVVSVEGTQHQNASTISSQPHRQAMPDESSPYQQAVVQKIPGSEVRPDSLMNRENVANQNNTQKRSRTSWLKGLGLTLGFIVLVAGALVYAEIRGTISLPFSLPSLPSFLVKSASPEALLQSAVENISEIGTAQQFSYSINAEYDIPDDLIGLGIPTFTGSKGTLELSGLYNGSDPTNPKTQFTFGVAYGQVALRGEFRMLDQTIYARLHEIPVFGLFDFSVFEAIWAKIALADIPTEDYLPETGYEKLESFLADPRPLSKEEIDELITVVRESGVIKSVDFVEKDEIEGAPMYHYTVGFDKVALQSLVEKQISNSLSDDYFGLLEDDLDELFASFDITSIDIWIGKRDARLYRMTLSGLISHQEFSDTIGVDLAINVHSYDRVLAVEHPQGELLPPDAIDSFLNPFGGYDDGQATPFEFVEGQVYIYDVSSAFEGARQSAIESRIVTTLVQLMTSMEVYYVSHPSNIGYLQGCSSPDIAKLLSEITARHLPADPICRDNENRFIAFAKLPSGMYYCVDSDGNRGRREAHPDGFTCGELTQ